MPTKLEIANVALLALGETRVTQTQLDNESTKGARAVATYYTFGKQAVLTAYPWRDARKSAKLEPETIERGAAETAHSIDLSGRDYYSGDTYRLFRNKLDTPPAPTAATGFGSFTLEKVNWAPGSEPTGSSTDPNDISIDSSDSFLNLSTSGLLDCMVQTEETLEGGCVASGDIRSSSAGLLQVRLIRSDHAPTLTSALDIDDFVRLSANDGASGREVAYRYTALDGTLAPAVSASISWVAGDRLVVHYDGNRVSFWHNDTLLGVHETLRGETLRYFSATNVQNQGLENIRFIPSSQVDSFYVGPPANYTRRFEPPADFVRLRVVTDINGQGIPYDFRSNRIECDEAEVFATYTFDLPESSMRYTLGELVGLSVALASANHVALDKALYDRLQQRFMMTLRMAKSLDAQQDAHVFYEPGGFLESRLYGRGPYPNLD